MHVLHLVPLLQPVLVPAAMEFLFRVDEDSYEEKAAGRRFSVEFKKSERSLSLSVAELELEDAALYFCSLGIRTVTRLRVSPVQKPGVSPPAHTAGPQLAAGEESRGTNRRDLRQGSRPGRFAPFPPGRSQLLLNNAPA